MTQHAKKPHIHSHEKHASANAKLSETIRNAAEPVQEAQEKIVEMGRDNMESMLHTASSYGKRAHKLAGVCSENINACVESGSKISNNLQNFSSEIMENCNRSFSNLAEIATMAVACRTPNDMLELQSRAVQQVFENYFNLTTKLYSMLFDSYSEAMEPIRERTSESSEQIRKAFAA
jgi:phasin family protein